MTTTSTTRMTSTNVTRDRGIGVMRLVLLGTDPAQQADAVAQCPVQQHGDPVCQSQHHRHHHGGLGDEPQAREPQLNTVPPIQEAAHPARLRPTAAQTRPRLRPTPCQLTLDTPRDKWTPGRLAVDDVRMVLQQNEEAGEAPALRR